MAKQGQGLSWYTPKLRPTRSDWVKASPDKAESKAEGGKQSEGYDT